MERATNHTMEFTSATTTLECNDHGPRIAALAVIGRHREWARTTFCVGFPSMAEAAKPSIISAWPYQQFKASGARQHPAAVV